MFVINQPHLMCCGKPRGKCTCPTRNEPGIGLPEYSFGEPHGTSVVNNAPEGGIGLPVYNFEAEPTTEPTGRNADLLGLPTWDW